MSDTRAAHQPGTGARAFTWTGAALFAASIACFVWFYLFGLAQRAPAMSATTAILVDIGLFALFAVHHSIFARSRFRAWIARAVSPYVERAVYVWIASVLFLAVCLAWQSFDGALWHTEGAARALLRVVQFAGVLLTLKAAGALDSLALAGVRQLDAPLPPSGIEHASSALRDTGLYGLVRHPIYFAWLLIVWAAPTMTAAHALFAAVSTAYLVIAIAFEERGLREMFGPAYADYAKRVPYKLVPGVF